MKSYKAFDKDYICRDYKYDLYKTNICKDEIETCRGGFHSCPDPHNIKDYYNVESENTVFAIVDVFGKTDIAQNNKIASEKLKIIKTFDKYEDLLEEFKVNKNSTIDFIEQTKTDLITTKHYDITGISSETVKEILYSISPENNYAKIIFFAMLLKTDLLNIIKPLQDFSSIIKFASKGVDDKDEIMCRLVNECAVYKDLANKLSRKQKLEFHALVRKFDEKCATPFKTLIKKQYKHNINYKVKFLKQTTYERKVINGIYS